MFTSNRTALGSPSASSLSRLDAIQSLRGFAALVVVIHHVALFLVIDTPAGVGSSRLMPWRELAMLGAIGVDLFFIVSGFVMAMSARRFRGGQGVAYFLVQRHIRIAPLFYLLSFVLLVQMMRSGASIDWAALVNTLTFVPFVDVGGYTGSLHPLGWTLAFEFVFYGVVAILIACGLGDRPAVLVVALAALPVLGFVTTSEWMVWHMLTNPIVWEFALGALAYLLWSSGALHRARRMLWAGVVLGAATLGGHLLFGAGPSSLHADLVIDGTASVRRTLFWGLPSFAVFCFAICEREPTSGITKRAAHILGDASYSLYLTHIFVIMALHKGLDLLPALHVDVVLLVGVAASMLAAVVVYQLVERPMLGAGRRLLSALFPMRRVCA